MHDHYVERVERTDGSGVGTGMVLGIIVVILVALIALFFLFGGPSRFATSSPASQTNVNVPAQSQPSNSAPSINVPRQIDVNVNGQQPSAPAAPSNSGAGNSGSSSGSAPSNSGNSSGNTGSNSGGNNP